MSHDPREVLDAVRRLEAGLNEIRTRAAVPGMAPGAEISVSEHAALVEDLELVVELVGNSWRATRDGVADIGAKLTDQRKATEDARDEVAVITSELAEQRRAANEARAEVATMAAELRDHRRVADEARAEVAAMAGELAELRRVADEARSALKDVKFELHLVRDGDAHDDAA